MGNLTGEIGGAQRLLAERAHGLADGVAGKTAEPAEHLPLLGYRQAFKTGLAMAGAALDVLLQALQQAVLAGNDADARKFLEGKTAAAERKADAEKVYAQAKENSDRMRQMTQKLNGDISIAENKLNELKSNLAVAEQQEKMNDLAQQFSQQQNSLSDYSTLADAVQKRIDAADAKAELNRTLDDTYGLEDLKKKYEVTTADAASNVSVDNELAALKAKLGK